MGDLSMDVFEESEKKGEALIQALKQACSRNKALEKRELWEQKRREDEGSRTSISLKSRDGEVRSVTRIPRGALVTKNSVNQYEEERQRNTEAKEDINLRRFCNGKDNAWRPDNFFAETCGEDETPPWPIRPMEIFTNPALCMRIMANQMDRKEKRKKVKKEKKAEREFEREQQKKKRKEIHKLLKQPIKKSKNDAKGKKKKKKQTDKGKKKSKDKGKEKKKASKRKRDKSTSSGSSESDGENIAAACEVIDVAVSEDGSAPASPSAGSSPAAAKPRPSPQASGSGGSSSSEREASRGSGASGSLGEEEADWDE